MISNGIHRYWWTTLLALPESATSPAYHALRRVWADSTINTVVETPAGQMSTKRNRGLCREDSEDHLMVVLFENWAAMPSCGWVREFLTECGVAVSGSVRSVGWSYEYTQDRPKKVPAKLTADIVVHWTDDAGRGVIVIETKKPGNLVWGDKDIPSGKVYCDLPGFEGIERRHSCLLIGAADKEAMKSSLVGEPVITWELLGSLQGRAIKELSIPQSVKSFMLGALIQQYARYGIRPYPALVEWLDKELPFSRIGELRQSGRERRHPYWQQVRQEWAR
jgi:hypothetical protein